MMTAITKIKSNESLKKLALKILIPSNDFRPRRWVRWFLNPFKHQKGRHSIIRSRTRIDVFPFNNFQLGSKSIIEDFTTINNGVGDVIIGDRTIIGMGNVIIGPVKIGQDVMLAQNIVVSGLNHGYKDISVPPSKQKVVVNEITISDNVWIGANSVVTAGVTIGKHAIVGAGSIVTKDVPPYTLVVGNPAKVVKKYDFDSGTWKKI